jgi:methylenetetrahydrofolate dehydrogenase (NADP+)/methenyltetrahydrofolate cyclohydrolase
VILDGKKIAEEIIQALEKERADFDAVTLGVVMSTGDAPTESFVKIKTRVAQRLQVDVRRFGPSELSKALLCDGVIVQMPIHNADLFIDTLPPAKDADGLGAHAKVLQPVAGALSEVLVRGNVSAAGKKAVVVGDGKLVGAPCAALLRNLGAHVSVISLTSGSLKELKDADIVVLGAGVPGLVKPEMLKEGVVLVDAGTSESAGKLVGDADPRCAEVASIFTPVPGGIGPVAVAMLFKNLFELKRGQRVD